MGIFDKHENEPSATESSALGDTGGKLVGRLLDVGIDGQGRFDSAQKIADDARRRRSDPERVIDDIVGAHTKLAAANGFLTGLGGFVTLPVALPANVIGFYIVATRMSAAVAAVRGYDLSDPATRSAILLALVGADADDLLKKAGYASSGRLANLAAERLPDPVLMAVNKGVGFRLVTQFGKRTVGKVLRRGVPLLGGVVGAGLDSIMLRRIADHVREEFPRRDTAALGPA